MFFVLFFQLVLDIVLTCLNHDFMKKIFSCLIEVNILNAYLCTYLVYFRNKFTHISNKSNL